MELTLPSYTFNIRLQGGRQEVFDPVRKRFIAFTPEESIRQHWIRYLTEEIQVPKGRMSVESGLSYNRLKKRTDLVVHDSFGKPLLLLECKAPQVAITESVFQQAAVYHSRLQVRYMLLSNGNQHVLCKLPDANQPLQFLNRLPSYEMLML
ncbi:MAG: type I restriction enzyme HsdR N-terminal domain-containing protein [Flavobacteriales bacterium]|nr:type I restriction enzyme HsdR N-terminal domain-containing protein [Flavobacteriales bacterium]